MAEIDQISNDLFFKLRNRFPNVQMGDESGAVTSNPSEARFFNFNYKAEDQTFGTVTCSLVDNQSLKIYFSQDITEDMQEHNQEQWFQFLRELRKFAKGHMLMFDVRDITKNQLDQNDIKFLSQYNKSATQISESRVAWERQGRFSNGDLNHVRIHVVHQNRMDENPHNRLSKVDKIYLVNSNNERFLLPFKSVLGAKAMAHYVANGGTPYDNHGQVIAKAVHEMKNLQRFNMATRNAQFESENSQKVRDASAYLKEQLKTHLQKIANGRNVEENLAQLETLVTLDDARSDVSEEMKQWFIQKHYNENLNNWIESAALAYKKFEEQQMNMAEKEDDSPIPSKDMTDVRAAKPAQIGDTIALYANDAKDAEMKKLLKTQPLRGMVSLIFADIAQRAVDDEIAILASRADAGEFTTKHKAMLQAYLKDLYSGNPNREEPAEKRHIKQNRKTAADEYADAINSLGNNDCGCQHNEEEQIDEINANQIKKDLDSGMSMDAVIGKHANKSMSNTDEIRKIIKQHAWDKRMKKTNEQGLEEEPNEGNEFSGALAKAKAAGAKSFKVGDKEYQVKEGMMSKQEYVDAMYDATDPSGYGDEDPDDIVAAARAQYGDKFADELEGIAASHWPKQNRSYGHDNMRDRETQASRMRVTKSGMMNKQDSNVLKRLTKDQPVTNFKTPALPESSVPVNVRHSQGSYAVAEDKYMNDVEEMLQDLKDKTVDAVFMANKYGDSWKKFLKDAKEEHGNTLRSTMIRHAEECLNVTEDMEGTDEAGVCNETPEGTMCPVHGLKECGSGYMEDTNEAAKPDFLDMDKDGDKEESMKKALKDKEKKVNEAELNWMKKLAGL